MPFSLASSSGTTYSTTQPSGVPEPGTLLLLSGGLLAHHHPPPRQFPRLYGTTSASQVNRCAVCPERFIGGQQDKLLNLRLCDQHPVERVAVMPRK